MCGRTSAGEQKSAGKKKRGVDERETTHKQREAQRQRTVAPGSAVITAHREKRTPAAQTRKNTAPTGATGAEAQKSADLGLVLRGIINEYSFIHKKKDEFLVKLGPEHRKLRHELYQAMRDLDKEGYSFPNILEIVIDKVRDYCEG